MLPTTIALIVGGAFFAFCNKKYLINLIKSTNKFRLFKFDPSNNTVQIMRFIGIGSLIIGLLSMLSVLSIV